MKKIIFLLMIFIGLSTQIYSVNERTYSVCDTCEYATLILAEDDTEQDLVTNDSALTFEIKGDEQNLWPDQAVVTFNGSVADATRFMAVTSSGTGRHSGVWDATVAFRIVSSGSTFVILDDFVSVDGIQVTVTGSTGYRYGIQASNASYTVKNCIIWCQNSNELGVVGMSGNGNGGLVSNNIVYDWPLGIYMKGTPEVNLAYYNTVVDCDTAFQTGYEDVTFRNNIGYNYTVFVNGYPYDTNPWKSGYNATDEADITYSGSPSGGAGDIYNIAESIFEDYGGNDFHLSAADVDCAEDGIDASALFTDANDIDGDGRPESTNVDIGADEFVAGGEPPAVIPKRRRKILLGGIYEKVFDSNYFVACCSYR